MSYPVYKLILLELKQLQLTHGSKVLMDLKISLEQAELLNRISADSLDCGTGHDFRSLFCGFDLDTDFMKIMADKSERERRVMDALNQLFLADAGNDLVCDVMGCGADKVRSLRLSYGFKEPKKRPKDARPVELVVEAVEAEYLRFDEQIRGENGVKGLVIVRAANALNMPINVLHKKLKKAIFSGLFSWPVYNYRSAKALPSALES